ncbi:hypothetical protein CBF34_08500 [Vagococcus penaei]|uniref:Uncharacterized protein n=1 Tax=Vagococcus penaei TaxID=633807 RepID=A0A1Q2D607_9ENTE|nr:helix-turn-helix domain-containing protein [Vagococcus penaei]AQP53751.1 hypothetical protein BW732_05530 [Vagococcus penaei]RSU00418.1 hypothetical protein CBF34_08500 [Vagococcus penaei]
MKHIGQLLITERERLKLALFMCVFQEEVVTRETVMNKYAVTERKLMSILDDLSTDLACISVDTRILYHRPVLMFSQPLSDKAYLITLKKLETMYYKQSNRYLLIMYLLSNGETTSAMISKALNLSQSYTYKIAEDLTRFFKIINLQAKIKREKGEWSIVGDEAELRLLDYLLHQISQPIVLTQISQLPEQCSHHFQRRLDPSSSQKYLMLSDICQSSQLTRGSILKITPETRLFFQLIAARIPEIDSDRIDNDSIFLCVMTVFIVPELVSKSDIQIIGQQLWEMAKTNSRLLKIRQMIDSMKNVMRESESTMFEDNTSIMYDLTLHYLVYKDFGFWKLLDVSTYLSDFRPYQFSLYEALIATLSFEPSQFASVFAFRAMELSYAHYRPCPHKQLKIYVMFYYWSADSRIVINSILTAYSDKVVTICNDLASADVVVTDVVLEDFNEEDTFYFFDFNNMSRWNHLSQFIQKKIMQKLSV